MALLRDSTLYFSAWSFQKAYKQCYSKVDYDSKQVARREAKRLQATYNQKYNVYQCPYCKKYHTGRDRKQRKLLRRSEFES